MILHTGSALIATPSLNSHAHSDTIISDNNTVVTLSDNLQRGYVSGIVEGSDQQFPD